MPLATSHSRITRDALLTLACTAGASANVGVFTGSGHTVKLTESAEVQLVRERVEIYPHRGPRLFTGGLPTDWVDFDCTFVLRNLKDSAVTLQVGFPLDSQFLNPPYDDAEESSAADLVHEYRFIARDESRTYHTSFHPFTDEFGSTFLWSMDFAPGETRTLRVSYGMDMSTSLADLIQSPDGGSRYEAGHTASEAIKALPWLERESGAVLESFQYITSTGASWAGAIERAEFIVHTWQFEEYLAARAAIETSPLDEGGASGFFAPYPTRFVRTIQPEGYAVETLVGHPKVEGLLRWTFAPFEAGDPIVGRYYKTVVPSTPEGTKTVCQQFIETYGADITLVRQYFAAWMGIEPADATLRSFCATQRWYKPVVGLSEADLGLKDQSILAEIDQLAQESR